jgi:adiponectin receptor
MSNQKASDVKIVSLEECEHDFLRDNEYIKHGYRVNFNSTGKILRSFFMYHNESVNVWSHLAGVLLFCFLLGYTVAWLGIPNKVSSFTLVDDFKSSLSTSLNDLASNAYRYESLIHRQISEIYKEVCILGLEFEDKVIDMYNKIKTVNTSRNIDPLIDKFKYLMSRIDSKEYDWIDIYNESYLALYKVSRWPIFVYIFSAMVCLGCSTVFHLFSAHSFKVNRNLSYLDYAGISILTSGSFYPPIYYAFYCYPCKVYAAYIYLYLGGISVASLITFIISFIPSFQSASMRWFRGTLFLILGLLGIIPLVHLLFL